MGLAHQPRIVSDGLVFFIDAANTRSYSGSGLTIISLIGGILGSLVNGVGFTSSNNGNLIFDGTNDQIRIDNTILSGSQDFTISSWIQSSGGTGTIFGNYPAGNLQYIYSPSYIGLWLNNNSAYANAAVYYKSSIVNLVAQRSGGSNLNIYLDGLLIKTGSSSSTIGNTSDFRFGATTVNAELFQGKIFNFKIYNRALSAQEILQNYNASKTRYGL